MSTAIEDRIRLEDKLREVLGLPEASTLLSYLPHDDPADLATKQDLAALEQRVDGRFLRVDERFERVDGQLTELRSGQDELRSGQDELRSGQDGLRSGMRELRLELHADMAKLRAEVRGDIVNAIAMGNRGTVLALATSIVGSVTLALAILRLAG